MAISPLRGWFGVLPASCAVRCLIVDDSAEFRDAASALLARAGISVVGVAANSAEALSLYHEVHPDVALVDIDLGVESGFDLAEQFHRLATSPPLAVILVSTYAEADLADMIAASPAVGFLQKFSLTPEAIHDLLEISGPRGT